MHTSAPTGIAAPRSSPGPAKRRSAGLHQLMRSSPRRSKRSMRRCSARPLGGRARPRRETARRSWWRAAGRWRDAQDTDGDLRTNNDITERRRAETLREVEEQWGPSLSTTDHVLRGRCGGCHLSVNPFGAEQLGYTAMNWSVIPCQGVFYEADREAVQSECGALARDSLRTTGRTMSWELRKVPTAWCFGSAKRPKAMLIKNRPVVLIVCEGHHRAQASGGEAARE
jgi:hypothetical protein